MTIKIYSLLILCFAVNVLRGQSSIDLPAILKIAQEKTLGVKLANSAKAQSEANYDYFKTTLKPGVGLDIRLPNYVNTSVAITQPDGTISFERVSQNNSSISLNANQNIAATGGQVFLSTDLQRFDDFSSKGTLYNGIPMRLGFFQPLFGFNSFKWDRKINEATIAENNSKYNVALEDANLTAAQLYFEVLVAAADRNIASTNKAVNQNLLSITEERFEIGKTAEDELLQLQAQLKLAALQETQALYAEQNAIAQLYTFLGQEAFPETTEFQLPEVLAPKKLNEEALINAALRNRALLKTYERLTLEADRNMAQTKADHGVQAALTAGIGFARGSDKLSDIYTDPFLEQQVALSVGLPLVDWGRKNTALKLAELQKQDLQNQFAQDQIDFKNEIRQRVRLFDRLQQEINLLKDIQDIAEQRFDISNKRYVLGNISLTDLTLAQSEKDQAQRNYIQGLRSYWVSYYELRKLTGEKI